MPRGRSVASSRVLRVPDAPGEGVGGRHATRRQQTLPRAIGARAVVAAGVSVVRWRIRAGGVVRREGLRVPAAPLRRAVDRRDSDVRRRAESARRCVRTALGCGAALTNRRHRREAREAAVGVHRGIAAACVMAARPGVIDRTLDPRARGATRTSTSARGAEGLSRRALPAHRAIRIALRAPAGAAGGHGHQHGSRGEDRTSLHIRCPARRLIGVDAVSQPGLPSNARASNESVELTWPWRLEPGQRRPAATQRGTGVGPSGIGEREMAAPF